MRHLLTALLLTLTTAATAQSPSSRLPGSHEVQISQPNGRPDIVVEDLRVKVRGGHLVVRRRWSGQEWLIAPNWLNLKFHLAQPLMAQSPMEQRKANGDAWCQIST